MQAGSITIVVQLKWVFDDRVEGLSILTLVLGFFLLARTPLLVQVVHHGAARDEMSRANHVVVGASPLYILVLIELIGVPLANHLPETLHKVVLHDVVVLAFVLEAIDDVLEFVLVQLHEHLFLLRGEHPVLFTALLDKFEAD